MSKSIHPSAAHDAKDVVIYFWLYLCVFLSLAAQVSS
jgi:hypothetical protein